MDMRKLSNYELLKEEPLSDLNSVGYILRHKKSGAKISIISNDDENKVFYIGFRTPPKNDTGVAHILEHSVLCGSKEFPVKDPFVELVKGSLNTFLNAMTYPDKTVYPIASCNAKDFQNLMHVYMDAVFYPNIYEREEIFRQEGWHYELEDTQAPITINGVVYNEMKGAFSSPEGVLEREIVNSLFPDNAYGCESGGNPKAIPELSYEEFLDFHKKYYHPSNSYIYLYGDMDVEEKLIWMDETYLSAFDVEEVDSAIPMQAPFQAPVEVTKPYSIASNETEEDNTYISYNKVIGTSTDKELYLAFDILNYALLGAPGAPLKQALLDAKIGKDVMDSYDNGLLQPTFSVIVKNTNENRKEEFLAIIEKVLKEQAANGVDKKTLEAGINSSEFKYREADFGQFPKGLLFGLQMLDSWLYDDMLPFIHLEATETFDFLRAQLNTNYYEELIQKYLLDNPHESVVMITPEKGLNAKEEKELEAQLKAYKETLSQEELEALVEKTKALKQYQDEPSPAEDLAKIPMLSRSDMKTEVNPFQNKEVFLQDGTLCLEHELFTNGIEYLVLMFDCDNIPEEYVPYIGLLKGILGYVDTKSYTYSKLATEVDFHTGGIHTGIGVYPLAEDSQKFHVKFEVKTKVFYDKIKTAFALMEEIISTSSLEDDKHLHEILSEGKSRMQMSMSASGNAIGALRCMSYFSNTVRYTDMTSGIAFYRVLDDYEKHFEEKKDELKAKLYQVMKMIFRPENLMVSVTADEEGFVSIEEHVLHLKKCLFTDAVEKRAPHFELTKKNEGFFDASQVQYVCRAGDFRKAGYEYTGALKILKVILSYDYLWLNVRVKGGAYGCSGNSNRLGEMYFASYRDPNLEKTNEVYNKTPEYLRNFQADERDMTKYIIGTISDMDVPLNPRAKGIRSTNAYINGITIEQLQKERNEVIQATVEDIRALADLVEAVLKQDYLCVIGNEEKLKEQKEMFMSLENLC